MRNGKMLDSFKALELRAGGATAAAAVLGVAYMGSYCAYKRTGKVPKYIERSLSAHLVVSNREFKKLLAIALA